MNCVPEAIEKVRNDKLFLAGVEGGENQDLELSLKKLRTIK